MERKYRKVYEDECFNCYKKGELGKDLHEHHPMPQSVMPNNNTVPMCGKCHSLIHHINIENSGELSKVGKLKAKVRNILANCFNTIIKPTNKWETVIAPQLKIPDITKRQVIYYLRKMYKIDAIVILTKVSKNDIKIIESDWKSKNFVNG